MSKSVATVFALVLLSMPVSAFAQEPSSSEAVEEAQFDKVTVFDIAPDEISGTLIKPGEEHITAKTSGKTSSLIKVRADFLPEMLGSVEDI